MKVTILFKRTMTKYAGGKERIEIELAENCTCDEALKTLGIDYREIPRFGFVAVNNMRVMIDTRLKDGDVMKVWPKVSGG